MTEKHDVFVGNLSYNTSEDQLREIFSTVGPLLGIRIVTDRDTGRPRGFAFIEYMDAATALCAIRNLDGHELNNRKLRVSYSNNSNLKDIAKSMGHVVPESYQSSGRTTQSVVGSLKLIETYDILEGMKKIIDEDRGHRARAILEAYPQLVPALIEMQRRLGMVDANDLSSISKGPSSSNSHHHQASNPTFTITENSNDQDELINQLLMVTEEELQKLPHEKRLQMIMLREQLGIQR